MITITNEVLDNESFVYGLKKLYESDALKPTTAYKVSQLFQIIREKSLPFFETKFKLLGKYGTEKPEEGGWEVSPEKSKEFIKEMRELFDIKIELDIDKIDWEPEMKLSGKEMDALKDVIDFSNMVL